MSSERLRQREVHRYYQSWLDSSVGFHEKSIVDTTRFHSDGTQFAHSKDTALTSFAQLGCLKINVKRAIVSLISTSRQYILAEATSSSFLSAQPDDNTTEGVWFGNASIPRSQGVSGSALSPSPYTARSSDGTSFTAPALVIDDLAKHPEFSSRPYAGDGVSFYCGVPITTKDGAIIGVYALTDDHPRQGLQPNELRYLCDLALIIMRHLETVKNEAARFRGELMVLGLGQFAQGAAAVSSHSAFRSPVHSRPTGDDPSSQPASFVFKGMNITAADPSALRAISRSQLNDGVASPSPEVNATKSAAEVEQNTSTRTTSRPERAAVFDTDASRANSVLPGINNIFARAANILRECCGADGVLFFDAVSTNLAKRSSTTGFQSGNQESESRHRKPRTSSAYTAADTSQRDSTTATSDDMNSSEGMDSNDEIVTTCSLLGYSVDVTEQTYQRAQELKRLAMTESILRRLIRRYPQGKIFYFGADAEMSSSENDITASSAASEADMLEQMEKSAEGTTGRMKGFRLKFADELKRLVPQAQSVVWLPLWDFSKQRWSAGAFLWTRMAEQLIVAQDDLTYLKTFADSIMVEVARQDAALADDTKSTFIANISHELRSPLHGVIGSCELLKDTALDDYQNSLVKAIELCGKTLNDTVNHVLDYTKINQLREKSHQQSRPGVPRRRSHKVPVVDESMLEDDFDLAILIQDAVETVCTSRSSHHQQLHAQSPANTRALVSENVEGKDVQVIFKIVHQDNWWVRSQPGAIKRILSNLVENALKYTDSGTITIALSSRNSSLKRGRRRSDRKGPGREQDVTIAVCDTGRGMSGDFIRNHAFTPFSQESTFSDGTGLGLSIVQLTVDSLGGRIELNSKSGAGTEIKVHLTLLRADPPQSTSEKNLPPLEAQVSGKSMCLVCPMIDSSEGQRSEFASSIGKVASTWLNMKVTRSEAFEGAGMDFHVYAATPAAVGLVRQIHEKAPCRGSMIILFTSDASEKLSLSKQLEGFELSGVIIEIALHPVGPRKLRDTLYKCLLRQKEARTITEMAFTTSVPSQTVMANKDVTKLDEGKRLSSEQGLRTVEQVDARLPAQIRDDAVEELRKRTSSHRQSLPSPIKQALPISDLSVDSKPTSDSRTSATQSSKVSPPQILPNTKRVLLVDDNNINLNILKAAMKKGNFAYETANDGLEALEAFKQAARVRDGVSNPFTHVLMDINMPVMDGIESTNHIRNFESEQARSVYQGHRTVRGRSLEGLSTVSFSTPSKTQDDNVQRHDNDEDDEDEDEIVSELAVSTPTTPTHLTTPNLPTRPHQRTRPLLSIIQAGNDPTRATTYSIIEGEATSFQEESTQQPHQSSRTMIIALSGVAFEQTQKDMFAAGADMFFAKPIKMKELLKLIEETPRAARSSPGRTLGGSP